MSTHIGAQVGEIAEEILLPGDPLRAKYIAENYLTDAVCFNKVRNMLGYTGTYQGKRVSVMGTGMGISSCAIYVYELAQTYGVKTMIRVGTAGAINEKLRLGDIVIANGACTTSDINRHIFPGTYCPLADFNLVRTAYKLAKQYAYPARVGNLLSGDLFYNDDAPADAMLQWQRYGVLAGEMESAVLFTLARKHCVRALTLATIADGLSLTGELTAAERERSLDAMITLGLDTLVAMQAEQEAAL